jgi:tetratricopeptide (TPR) repeat protein
LPINQNIDYDYPVYHSFFAPPVFLSFIFLSAVLGAAVWLICKSRREAIGNGQWAISGQPSAISSQQTTVSRKKSAVSGKQPSSSQVAEGSINDSTTQQPDFSRFTIHDSLLYRLIGFGILWFFIALSVESSVIPIADVIFEHRLYLPSVGAFMAATSGFFLIYKSLANEGMRRTAIGAAVVILACFSTATFLRNSVWGSSLSLWTDTVKKSPLKARVHNNLGFLGYLDAGMPDQAIEQYQIAIKLDPYLVKAHNNLGFAFFKKGLLDKAIEQYKISLSLRPNDAAVITGLADVYAAGSWTDRAIQQYHIASAVQPEFADAHINLAKVYVKTGALNQAIEEYQTALKWAPEDPVVHNSLGGVYGELGMADMAVRHLQIAVRLDPDYADAHYNLALAYKMKGFLDQAIYEFQVAMRLKPGDIAIRRDLAAADELRRRRQ